MLKKLKSLFKCSKCSVDEEREKQKDVFRKQVLINRYNTNDKKVALSTAEDEIALANKYGTGDSNRYIHEVRAHELRQLASLLD